ncbi:MAG: membrane protein FxsA [Rhizobiaceae bacterium]|nr:membrane protein FxsA [Rhizobiaceae bacterium]
MPLTFLPFALLIVPIAEISLFIVVGGKIGALWTIGLVLFTAILGSILLRIEGFRTFERIREKMNAGQIPGEELAKGAMILVAGVLLLTPGFITDSIGLALFLPFVRKVIWAFFAKRFTVQYSGTAGFSQSSQRDEHLDPDIVDLDPEDFHEEQNSKSPWFSELDDKRPR